MMVYQVYLVSSIKRRPCERNKRLDECKIGRMGHALICLSILNKGWMSILNFRRAWSLLKRKEQVIPLRSEASTNRYETLVQIK